MAVHKKHILHNVLTNEETRENYSDNLMLLISDFKSLICTIINIWNSGEIYEELLIVKFNTYILY